MGCVSSTGGDAHGDKTQTPYAALREGEMKLLLGNPGGGFANAWYCTGGCSADLICSDIDIDVDRAKKDLWHILANIDRSILYR